MDNIEDLMNKSNEMLTNFNNSLHSLNGEQLKQISPYIADLNKLTEMLSSGKHDENIVNEIKSKYAN